MKLRKAMAVALAGALVITTFVTGTTSEAAKKTKLKTKKVSIYVKGKKKISITGKKAKHKYTFTSKKKKIAKVSKKGVITGVKAGKTTIIVKDTWKQKGKKKTKKLGTVKVTVKKKAPTPKVTPNVPQVQTPQPPAPPADQNPGGGNITPPDNPVTPTPGATPKNTPKVTKEPTPTPVATQAPPPPEQQVPTTYAPMDMSQVLKPADAGKDAVLTYDAETNTITGEKILQFGVPLGYTVKNGHAVWVRIKGEITGENGFRCWLQDEIVTNDRCSEVWEELASPNFDEGRTFDKTFQLVSASDNATHLWFKGPDFQTPIEGVKITSIEVSYPLGDGGSVKDPEEPTLTMDFDKHNIIAGSTTTAEISASAGEVKEVTWSVENEDVATAEQDAEDVKKATITGVAAGETNVIAEAKVNVGGKDFTVKAEKVLKVAERGALVVNASIESAPTEVIVGDSADLKVTVDTGAIESVVWKVEGDGATIETDSVEAVKAVLKTTKVGKVTVSATVTVKANGKTATDTAKVTIDVIKDPTDIIEIDITKNVSVSGWGQDPTYEVQDDGSVKITWGSDTASYRFVRFNFDSMDLTGYWCVIDAEGHYANIDILDAEKKDATHNVNPYSVILPQYGKTFPFQIQLNDENLNKNAAADGTSADYANVNAVNIYKGEETDEFSLTIKSIKFYKYEEDIPKA